LLKAAGVDFLILETFFHLAEMEVALAAAADSGLATVATMSFRPLVTHCSDGYTPAECARIMADLGAVAVGANCEQDPGRMITLLREMRDAANVAVAAQPSAFRTTDTCHSFTRLPEFPDALETIQIPRAEFVEFGRVARNEGIRYVGGCCGCNAAYIRSLAQGVAAIK
jgi:betaine-homocysteine S-methyltransferase